MEKSHLQKDLQGVLIGDYAENMQQIKFLSEQPEHEESTVKK